MAAPMTKYSVDTLNDKNTIENNEEKTHIYSLIPYALTEYSSDANAKIVLFLDEIVHYKDSENNDCILGLVKSDVGERTKNWNIRNMDTSTQKCRLGKLGLNLGGVNYIIPNDGGLNTKPHIEFSALNPTITLYTNYVKLICNLRSAYWNDTTNFIVHMNWQHENNTPQDYSFALNMGTEEDPTPNLAMKEYRSSFPAVFNNGTIGGLYAGDTVTFSLTATNAEGTYTHEVTKTAVAKGALNLVIVYLQNATAQDPDDATVVTPTYMQNVDPSTGSSGNPSAKYAIALDESQYSSNGLGVGSGGIFYNLFGPPDGNGDPTYSADNPVNGITMENMPKGVLLSANETISDAYEKTLTTIPNGYYYGIPNTFSGTKLYYFRKHTQFPSSTTGSLTYYNARYTPAEYTVTFKYKDASWSSDGTYYIALQATLAGTLPNGVASVTVEIETNALRNPETIGTFTASGANNHRTILFEATSGCGYTWTSSTSDAWRIKNVYCSGNGTVTNPNIIIDTHEITEEITNQNDH